MLSTLKQASREKNASQGAKYKPSQKPRKGGQGSPTPGGKKENKCHQCGKLGHFRQKCPEGKKEEKIIPLIPLGRNRVVSGSFIWMGSMENPR
jgi:hypothetical protein